jgi:hypothetical protein
MTSPETLELEAVDAALAGRYVAPEHAELAELALLLRDEKPEPTPAWATQLDRRVEAGFPARPRERRAWIWLRNVAPAIGLAVCVVAIATTAVVIEPGGDDEEGSGGGAAVPASEDSAAGEESQTFEPLGKSGRSSVPPSSRAGDPSSDNQDNRFQQRSASLTLGVPRREIDRVAARVAQVTADLDGFVASSSTSSNEGGSLELRVPTDRLDTAIQRLSRLGRVRELSRRSVDITSNVVSSRERLADARTERKALLEQLASADTVNETESIRERLEIVSREISRARRALARVNNRANFADVFVTLAASRGDDDEEGAWTPADAFDDALRVLEVAVGVALIAAAVVLPLALIWLLTWLALRGLNRRRRERALDMA